LVLKVFHLLKDETLEMKIRNGNDVLLFVENLGRNQIPPRHHQEGEDFVLNLVMMKLRMLEIIHLLVEQTNRIKQMNDV
jgi:hypothetical protein